MNLEIEIRSEDARNDVYELRNLLLQEGDEIQIHIKEQAPQEGEMTLGLVEPIIIGVLKGVVEHSVSELYAKKLKPRIDKWLASRKQGKLEVLSTLKDESTQIHFLEDNNGRSEVFETLKYAIDVDHTRAVLIGNSEFDGGFSAIPPVKGNLEDLYHLLTDKLHIGLLPENIVVAFNKTNTEIEEILLQQSRIPNTETLIIYFAGHGHRTDVRKLYLVAKNSKRIDDYLLGGIDFDFISNVILRNASAKQKILILDACHSGIATQGADDLMEKMDVKGSYVLASSPGDEVSYFEKNSRNTYFTGVLLNALKEGVQNSNEMIALDDLYEYSKDHLSEKNFPHPIYKNELNIPASNFFIARNPSFSFEILKKKPELLFKEGRVEEALYEYRMLLQRYPEDLELRRKASECETNALFNRLVQDGDELFFHMKDYNAATDKYRKALQIKDDMLVRGKLSRCQSYYRERDPYPSLKEEKEVQKMSSAAEKQKPFAIQEIKEVSEPKEKAAIPVVKKEEKKQLLVSNNDKAVGIVLASLWLVLSAYFIFHALDKNDSTAFEKASIPAGSIGIALIIIRWKKMIVTEMLFYAPGFYIFLFPLMVEYFDSKQFSAGILLLLVYNAGFLVLVIKKLKEFKLADMIIASIQILYLSLIFFYTIFYISFKPEYGDNETANIIGLVIGLVAAIAGIILMRKHWIASKRK